MSICQTVSEPSEAPGPSVLRPLVLTFSDCIHFTMCSLERHMIEREPWLTTELQSPSTSRKYETLDISVFILGRGLMLWLRIRLKTNVMRHVKIFLSYLKSEFIYFVLFILFEMFSLLQEFFFLN